MTTLSFWFRIILSTVLCCGEVAQGRVFLLGMVMSNTDKQDRQLYLGIDGGGSKCRAVIYCSATGLLGQGLSGPANVLRGTDKAIKHIVQATDIALAEAGFGPDKKSELIAGIGLAGLNLESYMDEILKWQHPFKQAYFTSDLHIACIGAHDGKDGAVIIAGTGSSGLACVGGQHKEVGGHGFPVGDCGSGAWLGLKAIEITLQALDGIKPTSAMTSAILQHYQVSSAIELAQLVAEFLPVDYAKLAPLVIAQANAQDPHAMGLLQTGVDYLSAMALRLAGQEGLVEQEHLPLSLIGGLTPIMAVHFDHRVKSMITTAQHAPEIGAVLYAQNQSNQ